ncbi:TonB-dependent receptor PqqU [Salmonella enterica subsp. enterica serovar Enteritidis]|uniref:TonB-dependent receptor n=1 Tax=Salmonella enterica TaxID=28901 RepID=A0A737K9P6_SALER|nr:TonB-dependent receptor PqqU [Salmonella enterica]AHQ12492.1 TonB-dependent receptor [Salmonella enterica subsp. enterica serovar Enteritidis str. SA20094352]AHR06025.2 TonB-dependent receptor [Salmonella enterica subsp. enterica serovar Enteritidis str. EC20120200]AMK63434.1 TonB-dependent receptor [Salmonella enterica subsp. enterica serovar Enteritidis str. SA20095440]ECF8213814.1 TonB-dependent receptor [Salmonella enterica]ECS4328709.1 TonB-dependent receptor [Salmonella enterica subsp
MKIISVRQRLYPALLLPLTFSPVLQAASASNEQTMIVTATPQTVSELDTPAAVSVIEGEDMRLTTPRVNLSETLTSVPGLQVQNRQNYAQDLQISIRGFGSRSAFGVRGIRLYVDGIPATMPDGQGQISNIDINSIQDVEVLRGPFSALYGNASGGVINVTTETGIEASSYYGSYGSWRYGLKATGAMGDGTQPGDVDYTVSTTRFTTHGYRDHSGARKNLANAKLGVRLDDVSKLSLIFNSVDIKADDPGGLTESEWKADPQQAPRAEQYNTRKTIKQTQAGLRYERQLSAQDDISVMAYAGERETTQYQSIPLVAQLKPAQAGGVITLQRHYQGIDSRWTHRGELGVPVTFTGGLNYENMSENRKGYNNFRLNNGPPEFGHKGDLRRDERNLMWNVDPYLQTQWQLTQKLSLDAGVRYSSVWFDSNDHYIAPGNGDDSGDASYHHWLPAGSLKYALTDAWNLYLAAGRGFETPTINELSYRADGQSGFNFDLKPSTNDTVEVGSKTRIGNGLLTAALFQTDTDDEIVVASSMGGRTTYKNAGKTRRQGAELALDQRFAGDWRVKASWTWLDATYRSNVCQGQNCDGNRMPGIARNMGFASLGFIPDEGWYAGTDVRYMGDIMANDENTAKAPSYTVVGLNTGYKFNYSQLTVDIFGRVDNLFDKEYIGSVIVNESNGRYYEPAPGRNYGVGINLAWQFE